MDPVIQQGTDTEYSLRKMSISAQCDGNVGKVVFGQILGIEIC